MPIFALPHASLPAHRFRLQGGALKSTHASEQRHPASLGSFSKIPYQTLFLRSAKESCMFAISSCLPSKRASGVEFLLALSATSQSSKSKREINALS